MTKDELNAIRERDAEYDNPGSIAGECPLQAMDDRRAMLAYIDQLLLNKPPKLSLNSQMSSQKLST
jgi:hypothetical protein